MMHFGFFLCQGRRIWPPCINSTMLLLLAVMLFTPEAGLEKRGQIALIIQLRGNSVVDSKSRESNLEIVFV